VLREYVVDHDLARPGRQSELQAWLKRRFIARQRVVLAVLERASRGFN
jgi:hypothetical protein